MLKEQTAVQNASWEQDAALIKPQTCLNLTYRTASIDNWFENRDTHVLISCRGMGKTQLLKAKRYYRETELESTTRGVCFLPADAPFVDQFNTSRIQNLNQIPWTFLSDINNCKVLWEFSIIISVIAGLDFERRKSFWNAFNLQFRRGQKSYLRTITQQLLNTPNDCDKKSDEIGSEKHETPAPLVCTKSPSTLFINLITEESQRNLATLVNTNSFATLSNVFYDRIQNGYELYIDAAEDTDTARFMVDAQGRMAWSAIQNGLKRAINTLTRTNSHFKIYAAIRKEAHACDGDNPDILAQHPVLLQYSPKELSQIADHLAKKYENSSDFCDWLGFSEVPNIIAGTTELAFEYMERHTLQRPRDIVVICQKLAHRLQHIARDNTEERLQVYREIVNGEAGNVIALSAFNETSLFLSALGNIENLSIFRSLLTSNILKKDELKPICTQFNCNVNPQDTEEIIRDCRAINCQQCRRLHPFCDLYRIGLIGKIHQGPTETTQNFLEPHDYVFGREHHHVLPEASEFYFFHPAFDEFVRRREVSAQPYIHIQGIVVGYGKPWTERDRKKTLLQKNEPNLEVFIQNLCTATGTDPQEIRRQVNQFIDQLVDAEDEQTRKNIFEQFFAMLPEARDWGGFFVTLSALFG